MTKAKVTESVVIRRKKIGDVASKADFYTDDNGTHQIVLTDKDENYIYVFNASVKNGKRVDFDDVKDTDVFTIGKRITVSQL